MQAHWALQNMFVKWSLSVTSGGYSLPDAMIPQMPSDWPICLFTALLLATSVPITSRPRVFMLCELTTLVSCPLSVRLVLTVVTAISRYIKKIYLKLFESIRHFNFNSFFLLSQCHHARRAKPLVPPGPLQRLRVPPAAPPWCWRRLLPQLPILRTLANWSWSRSICEHSGECSNELHSLSYLKTQALQAHAAAEAAVRAQQAQGPGLVGPSGNIGPSGLCGPSGCVAFGRWMWFLMYF